MLVEAVKNDSKCFKDSFKEVLFFFLPNETNTSKQIQMSSSIVMFKCPDALSSSVVTLHQPPLSIRQIQFKVQRL